MPLYVVEKVAQLRQMTPEIIRRNPGQTIHALSQNKIGLARFDPPYAVACRVTGPTIAEPVYRWGKDGEKSAVLASHAGRPFRAIAADDCRGAVSIQQRAARLVMESDAIVLVTGGDYVDAISFVALLSTLGIDESEVAARVRTIVLRSMVPADIKRAFDAPITMDSDTFLRWRRAGEAKRFFDFNWRLNAYVTILPIWRKMTASQSVQPSKNAIQLLYWLRDQAAAPGYGAVLTVMDHWPLGRGTTGMGSYTSRAQILNDLAISGMMTLESGAITTRGRTFLDQLHPKCKDLALPGRLEGWMASWPESRHNMERYLRTWFGRQKRFSQRGGERRVARSSGLMVEVGR